MRSWLLMFLIYIWTSWNFLLLWCMFFVVVVAVVLLHLSTYPSVLFSFHCSLWFKCCENDGNENVYMCDFLRVFFVRFEFIWICIYCCAIFSLSLCSTSFINKQVVTLNLDKNHKQQNQVNNNKNSSGSSASTLKDVKISVGMSIVLY